MASGVIMQKSKIYVTRLYKKMCIRDRVNDVLDMSKLESGEIVLEETPFNLSKILSLIHI